MIATRSFFTVQTAASEPPRRHADGVRLEDGQASVAVPACLSCAGVNRCALSTSVSGNRALITRRTPDGRTRGDDWCALSTSVSGNCALVSRRASDGRTRSHNRCALSTSVSGNRALVSRRTPDGCTWRDDWCALSTAVSSNRALVTRRTPDGRTRGDNRCALPTSVSSNCALVSRRASDGRTWSHNRCALPTSVSGNCALVTRRASDGRTGSHNRCALHGPIRGNSALSTRATAHHSTRVRGQLAVSVLLVCVLLAIVARWAQCGCTPRCVLRQALCRRSTQHRSNHCNTHARHHLVGVFRCVGKNSVECGRCKKTANKLVNREKNKRIGMLCFEFL